MNRINTMKSSSITISFLVEVKGGLLACSELKLTQALLIPPHLHIPVVKRPHKSHLHCSTPVATSLRLLFKEVYLPRAAGRSNEARF